MVGGEGTLINVHARVARSAVNGPGLRSVVWVQGCSLGCPGCFNPETHGRVPRERLTVRALADWALSVDGVEGLSLSGGEPFQQAGPLADLARRVREGGRSVLAFSGYTIEEIRALPDPGALALLAELDLLVDGRYQAALQAAGPWRGSSNQRIHVLGERYRGLVPDGSGGPREAEVRIEPGGAVSLSGFPDGRLLAALIRER